MQKSNGLLPNGELQKKGIPENLMRLTAEGGARTNPERKQEEKTTPLSTSLSFSRFLSHFLWELHVLLLVSQAPRFSILGACILLSLPFSFCGKLPEWFLARQALSLSLSLSPMADLKPEEINHPPMDQLQGFEYCIDSNPSWGNQRTFPFISLSSRRHHHRLHFAGESIALGFQHYILALGTAVMIPSMLVPLMGGSNVRFSLSYSSS